MSLTLSRRVWKVRGLKPIRRLVLLYMADVARDPEHQFFEAHEKTAAALDMSERTLAEHKAALIKAGHATVMTSKRRVVRDGARDTLKIHPVTVEDYDTDSRKLHQPQSKITTPTVEDYAAPNKENHLYPNITPSQLRADAFVKDREAVTGVSNL